MDTFWYRIFLIFFFLEIRVTGEIRREGQKLVVLRECRLSVLWELPSPTIPTPTIDIRSSQQETHRL